MVSVERLVYIRYHQWHYHGNVDRRQCRARYDLYYRNVGVRCLHLERVHESVDNIVSRDYGGWFLWFGDQLFRFDRSFDRLLFCWYLCERCVRKWFAMDLAL